VVGPGSFAIANEAYGRTEPDYRPLVDLAMQGHSPKEIAEQLGMTESAVRRRWEIVEEQWQRVLGLTGEPAK
jgi:DNA-directed RNA polymerase specialized sigma24 family protein